MRNVLLTPEEIGFRIKEARKAKGFAQSEFAEMIGKSVRTLQKYETGDISMPLDVLNDIAIKLDMSITDLSTELQPGVQIETLADVFSTIFALDKAQGINMEIAPVTTNDNKKVTAIYFEPATWEYKENMIVNDFLNEYIFYRDSLNAGTMPAEIYKAWSEKALIAADENILRKKVAE